MRFAAPKVDFGQLPRCDIPDRANDLDAASFTSHRFSDNMQVFDPCVWHQETKLDFDSFSPVSSCYRHVHRRDILRMNALSRIVGKDNVADGSNSVAALGALRKSMHEVLDEQPPS
jgi:hypothetical protein